MLWYKNWLETRWRFVIGLGLLICSVTLNILSYPTVVQMLPMAESVKLAGPLGDRVREALELSRTFDGYVWSHWVRQNFLNIWTLFAVLLGAGGLVSKEGGGALFTLSLPISRERLLISRVLTGLGELAVLALVPSLMLPVLAQGVGQHFDLLSSLAYGLCMFIGGAVFFNLAILLSTQFPDIWRPLLITLGLALAFGTMEELSRSVGTFGMGIFATMGGGAFFMGGGLPWMGLLLSALVSSALLFVASMNLERRDF